MIDNQTQTISKTLQEYQATRLNKMFNGELQQVLETFNEAIWAAA